MRALFQQVAPEFDGETVSKTLYTPQPEGSMVAVLAGARDRFEVTIGSYPDTEGHNRLKLTGTDPAVIDQTAAWLRERIDVIDAT